MNDLTLSFKRQYLSRLGQIRMPQEITLQLEGVS